MNHLGKALAEFGESAGGNTDSGSENYVKPVANDNGPLRIGGYIAKMDE